MKLEKDIIDQRIEKFRTAARESGIKLTHQRLEIFREVASSVDHPNAESVFQAVQKRMPTVSLDTVYRTLWKLSDLNLITTLSPRNESVRFDANLEHHHHYVCTHCGLARDFESHALNALHIPAAVREFGTIVATRVEIRGVCESCEKKKAKVPLAKKPLKPKSKEK